MIKWMSILFVAAFFFAGAAEKVIYVDLSSQMIYAREGDRLYLKGHISSGMRGRETPVGTYRIGEKKKEHTSTLWPKPNGGAKMPYMLRLGGTPYALHLGNLPGYPASHGCIRVEKGIAEKLFNWADLGTPVRVYGRTPRKKGFKVSFVPGYTEMGARIRIKRRMDPQEVSDYFGDMMTKVREPRRGYE